MRSDLPSGTVTFLFTDVEGSTRLLHSLGAEGYAEALAEHRRVIREACTSEGGLEVDTQGDAFFFAFPTAPGALAAASAFTEALAAGPVQVRVGLHTGSPLLTAEGYVGDDVHFAARVAASAHGGQVVLSAATAECVEGSLTDLGEYRLKDIEQAVPLYQLGNGTFPPLKTISNTNLPRPASSFVGREKEVDEVIALFGNGARLLTLTGPGGSGKTRLALEAAAELVPEFKAGVFWVGVAPLRDPALVTEQVAQTLGSKNGLADHIAEREMLLLLDNLEQVVEAAPELATLVESCPNLKLLCTSRELLRVRGEVEYPVLPLAEPEAVSLFCERARLEPSDEIAELCRRLDSLPLALELAAARAKVLSVAQILERLAQRLDLLKGGRDADPRQQTLRATIEWSYELLSGEEQRLFSRLAVFAGGCTLDSAEEVADADLDTLHSLVDKSLLRFTNERYWMLETIREYAAERLEESGDADELRRRHAEHFLDLAEEIEPRAIFGSPDEKGLLDRIEGEHDNLRAALDHLEAAGDGGRVLRLAGGMWPYWALRGPATEGQRRLERALHREDRPTAARARALTGAAVLTGEDASAMRACAEEALSIYRELEDLWGTTHSVFMLGHAACSEGDYEQARGLWDESRHGFREVGDDHFATVATDCLAWVYDELGDSGNARALYEDNLRRAHATSNGRMEAYSRDQLARLALAEGQVQEALHMLKQSLFVYRELDAPMELAESLGYFAAAAAKAGRAETATRLLAGSRARYEEVGAEVPYWLLKRDETTLERIHEQLDEDAFERLWVDGHALTRDEAVALAFELDV